MESQKTTVRMGPQLAARLRRAHYLTKRSQNDIIKDALSHWLVNPRYPGCNVRQAVEPYISGDDVDKLTGATP